MKSPSCAALVRYLNINWADVDKEGKILSFVKVFTFKQDNYVGTAYKQLIAFMKQEKIKYKDESVEIYINAPRTTIRIPVSE
jgi:hypothetical protein